MFFVLSKVLFIFILPLTWIVVCLFFALFSKRADRKKKCLLAAIILLLFFSNEAILQLVCVKYQPTANTQVDTATTPYSCGILLGGMGSADKYDRGYFTENSDRFIQTLALWQQGKIKYILVSGGNGTLNERNYREGDFLRAQLLRMNVPDSVILNENAANNTFENAVYCKRILDSLQLAPPYVLITSATHMPRSEQVYTKAGLQIVPYPCNYLIANKKLTWDKWLLPDTRSLYLWNKLIKEWVGIAAYKITGKA